MGVSRRGYQRNKSIAYELISNEIGVLGVTEKKREIEDITEMVNIEQKCQRWAVTNNIYYEGTEQASQLKCVKKETHPESG